MPKAEPDEDPLYTPIRVFTHKTFKKNDIKNSDWQNVFICFDYID